MKRETDWGLPIKEVYTPEGVKDIDYHRDLNDPGEYPFTRGTHRLGYRSKDWTKRMVVGFGLPKDTNSRLKFLRSVGERGGICLVQDRPTNLCIDSDHPLARKEVGLEGVPFCSKADLEEILDGIPLLGQTLALQCTASSGPVVLGQLICLCEKRRVDITQVRGNVGLSAFSNIWGQDDGQPFELAFKLNIDQVEYMTRQKMKLHFHVSILHIGESGLNGAYQLGIGMASLKEFCDALFERGLEIDDFAHRIACEHCFGMRFFEEIAKVRALRRMWARMAKEKYGARKHESLFLNMPIHTSGRSLTYQQPLNNIARGAIECLAGTIAGCTGMEVCAYDEPLCEPTELSSRIALATQHIIAYETGVADVTDPLGGSYYVEYLTNGIEQAAYKIWNEIEAMGGLRAAIKKGWYDNVLDKTLRQYQSEIDNRERLVIGVNHLVRPPEEEESIKLHEVPPEVQEAIVRRLEEVKRSRNLRRVTRALENLYLDVQKGDKFNLQPSIIEAVRVDATLGEILGTIREAKGYSYDPYGMIESPFKFGVAKK